MKSNDNNVAFTSIVLTAFVLMGVVYIDHNHGQVNRVQPSNLTQRSVLRKGCSSLDSDGPKPVIFLSTDSAESEVIWKVVGDYTGEGKGSNLHEFMEAGSPGMDLFHQIEGSDGAHRLLDFMCEKQKEEPESRFVGFDWKPLPNTFSSQTSINGLKLLANSSSSPVKVIRIRRNPLDAVISQQMAKLDSKISLSTDFLVTGLATFTKDEDSYDKVLEDMNIPHIHVSYEKLFQTYSASEWQRILHFLDIEKRVTFKKVGRIADQVIERSQNRNHRKILKNYDEVKHALTGTGFEGLLH